MAQNEYAVRLEHVTKTFGPVVANKDVSLGVRRGEILALRGENGSGKTTKEEVGLRMTNLVKEEQA